MIEGFAAFALVHLRLSPAQFDGELNLNRLNGDCKVDVKEPPQGVLPPAQHVSTRRSSSPTSRVRQFRARASAGLRVRAQPSLQGEQIGVVACGGSIAFVEQLCNDDGTWLRLSLESMKDWCSSDGQSEAWCQVVECGASGHNIRAQPSLKALPVGKLKLGAEISVVAKVLSSFIFSML